MSRVTMKLRPLSAAMLWLACTPHTAASTWFKSRMTNKRQLYFGVKTWHYCQKYYPLEDEEMSGCINTPRSVLSCHCKMKLKLRKAFESGQTNCFGKLTVETFQNEVLFLWTEADPACFVTAWKSQHTKSDIWAKCTSAERYKIPRCWALAPQIYPTIFQKTYAILSKLLQVSGSQGSEMTHDLHILTVHCLVLASRHFLFPWVGCISHFGGKPLRVLARI